MAYDPTNWKTGDVVTSAKLNKLEQGVKNSITLPVVTFTIDNSQNATCDHTYAELLELLPQNGIAYVNVDMPGNPMSNIFAESVHSNFVYFSLIAGNPSSDVIEISSLSFKVNSDDTVEFGSAEAVVGETN